MNTLVSGLAWHSNITYYTHFHRWIDNIIFHNCNYYTIIALWIFLVPHCSITCKALLFLLRILVFSFGTFSTSDFVHGSIPSISSRTDRTLSLQYQRLKFHFSAPIVRKFVEFRNWRHEKSWEGWNSRPNPNKLDEGELIWEQTLDFTSKIKSRLSHHYYEFFKKYA